MSFPFGRRLDSRGHADADAHPAGYAGPDSDAQQPADQLRVVSNGADIGTNDNWQSSQAAEITGANLAPPNALDSAISLTLQPGSYTAIVSGVGLVEAYELP